MLFSDSVHRLAELLLRVSNTQQAERSLYTGDGDGLLLREFFGAENRRTVPSEDRLTNCRRRPLGPRLPGLLPAEILVTDADRLAAIEARTRPLSTRDWRQHATDAGVIDDGAARDHD